MTDEEISMTVGLAIAERRKELGMSVVGLSKLASINRSYLIEVEKGSKNATIVKLTHIARALQVEPRELLSSIE